MLSWPPGSGGQVGAEVVGRCCILDLGSFSFSFPHIYQHLFQDFILMISLYPSPQWYTSHLTDSIFFFSVKLFTIKLFYVDLYFGIYIFWTVPFSLHSLILSACCLVYHPSKLYYHASLLCLPVNPLIALCFLLFYKGCGSLPLTRDVVIGFHCLSCI